MQDIRGRSPLGTHFLGELRGCQIRTNETSSAEFVASIYEAVRRAALTPIGHVHHVFPDGGMTLIVALAESHLSIHTWPSTGIVTLDVFVCHHTENHSAHGAGLFSWLCEQFKPVHISHQRIERG